MLPSISEAVRGTLGTTTKRRMLRKLEERQLQAFGGEFVSSLKFADSELPFAKSVLSAVQQMMALESPAERVLRGKTGYAASNNEHFSWFIGYLSAVGESVRVVTLLDMSDASQLAERREIAEECLRLRTIEK
jgi:beta-lactamase class D